MEIKQQSTMTPGRWGINWVSCITATVYCLKRVSRLWYKERKHKGTQYTSCIEEKRSESLGG